MRAKALKNEVGVSNVITLLPCAKRAADVMNAFLSVTTSLFDAEPMKRLMGAPLDLCKFELPTWVR